MDKLEVGDIFYIKVLDETLAYQIDQILTVLPEETDGLSIESGKDYATLVTCTPFAINTHRLFSTWRENLMKRQRSKSRIQI